MLLFTRVFLCKRCDSSVAVYHPNLVLFDYLVSIDHNGSALRTACSYLDI